MTGVGVFSSIVCYFYFAIAELIVVEAVDFEVVGGGGEGDGQRDKEYQKCPD